MTTMQTTTDSRPPEIEPRALKILAKSVYRELKAAGYDSNDIVSFTSELLEHVTSDLRDGRPGR